MEITWNDNEAHKSVYGYDWLIDRNFSPENRDRYLKTFYRPEKLLWSKSDWDQVLQHFDFKKIVYDDQGIYKFKDFDFK